MLIKQMSSLLMFQGQHLSLAVPIYDVDLPYSNNYSMEVLDIDFIK